MEKQNPTDHDPTRCEKSVLMTRFQRVCVRHFAFLTLIVFSGGMRIVFSCVSV